MRFLIIQTASIGDVILSTPLAELLHRCYATAEIDVLVKKGNEGLFDHHPFIREVLVWDKSGGKLIKLLRLIKTIRKRQYDLVVNCHRYVSTGILTAFSRAKESRGFSRNPLSFLFTRRIRHEFIEGLHEKNRNLMLLNGYCKEQEAPVRLYPSAKDEELVKSISEGPLITISPASLWATKQYPAGKWSEFISRLPESYTVILTGSRADYLLCAEIINKAKNRRAENFAGRLTLLQAAALMKKARMNYTNDSAPMHLASAVNAPVTAVFCSTVTSFGFGPLSDRSFVVECPTPLACRPCGIHGHRTCPEKHFRCALDIGTDQLLKTLHER